MTEAHNDWIDWAMAAVVVLSVLIGLLRGFVFEVLALAGWLAALVIASWLAPWLDRFVGNGEAASPLRFWGVYVVCFIGALLLWKLAARALQGAIRRVPVVGSLDRLLGAAFGFLRAVVLLLLVTVGVAYTPAAASAAWQRSTGAAWLTALWRNVRWAFPAGLPPHGDPCDDAAVGGCQTV